MKRSEVALGRTYLAKVSDRVVPVRLDGEHPKRGWLATNQVTGNLVHIQSPQRLRSEIKRDGAEATALATAPAAPEAPPSPTDEPGTAPATPTRTPSYDERLMFNGATDPAAARAALANIHTGGTEEDDMASSKKTKKTGATKTTKAAEAKTAATKPATPAKAKTKLSALDAAAKVLEERGEPMSTGDMIEEMAAKRYWKSPGGKTPAATLYSAILREINLKGKDARFKKTDRGMFAFAK